MGRAWTKSPFRPGAVAFEVYNEASVVYFFDETNRKAIRKTALGKLGTDAPPRTLAALAKKKLFLEFSVPRGSPFLGFVAVGPPPTAAELAGWDAKAPRAAGLSLPSGHLRIETAGSFSLGPDLVYDAGLFVEVPPGDYTLTLVDVDDPAGARFSQTFLTLTPADGSDLPAAYTVVTRPAEPPPPPLWRYAAYTIEGSVFRGRIAPDGCETGFDAPAAETLGLRFGSALRVTVGTAEATAYFLAGQRVETLRQLGEPGLAAEDPLVTGWVAWADLKREPVLSFRKWSGGVPGWGPDPRGRWRPLTVARSPLPPLAFGPLDPGDWSAKRGTVRGRVLTCSPTVLTLNVGGEALAATGARPRDAAGAAEFLLTIGGETRRLTVFDDPGVFPSKRLKLYFESGDSVLGSYLLLRRRHRLGDDPDAFVAAVGRPLVEQLSLGPLLDRIREEGLARALEPRPFPRPLALFGGLMPHWSTPGREVLWVEAAAFARDEIWHSLQHKNTVPHEIGAAPGAEVTLAKA
jgi:hypothetical protein